MIKLETHCHTKGGSSCADAADDVLIRKYVDAGYGGVVITNHISRGSYAYHCGETHADKVRFYFSLIENMREKFAPHNVKVFCGAEVRTLPQNGAKYGEEFMLYGITERLMRDTAPLFTFSQEELFRFAEKHGLFMFQTHPYREGVCVMNPKFMHGVEVFNGHFHHVNNNALAEIFRSEHGLIGLSGTDFYHDDQPLTAGIYVPESVCSDSRLIDFIFKNEFEIYADAITYERALKKYKGII